VSRDLSRRGAVRLPDAKHYSLSKLNERPAGCAINCGVWIDRELLSAASDFKLFGMTPAMVGGYGHRTIVSKPPTPNAPDATTAIQYK
jgi:hypothetical protein